MGIIKTCTYLPCLDTVVVVSTSHARVCTYSGQRKLFTWENYLAAAPGCNVSTLAQGESDM